MNCNNSNCRKLPVADGEECSSPVKLQEDQFVREFGQLCINNGRKQAEKVAPQKTANMSNGGGDYSVKLRNRQPTHDEF
jgi:hypothetical protein